MRPAGSTAGPGPGGSERDGPAAARRLRLLALLVALWAAAVHAGTLWNGFVYDDHPQVLGNRWISDLRNLPTVFSTGVWEFEGTEVRYYRPVMHLVYMLAYRISGLDPWAYHLFNVALHATVSALVFSVAVALLARAGYGRNAAFPALAAGLLFAAHPALTETVAWVACIPELTYAPLFLLALLLYVRAPGTRSAAYAGSVAAFFASLFCKEPAITLPAVLVAFDLAYRRGDGAGATARRLAPYLLAAAAYLAIRAAVLPWGGARGANAEMGVRQALANVPVLLARYLGKLLVPVSLNAYHLVPPVSGLASALWVASAIASVTFVAVIAESAYRRRPILAALALLAAPLLPVLYIPLIAGENFFAERFLYLSTAGLAVLVAFGLGWLASRAPARARRARVPLAALLLVFAVATVRRDRVWRDDESLWTDALAKSPHSAVAHHELGVAYLRRGRDDLAARYVEEALRLDPRMELAHYNLAGIRERAGRLDEAIEEYRLAVGANPRLAEGWNNLGEAYRKRGELDEAARSYREALRLRPDAIFARLNLARVYGQLGRPAESMQEYSIALRDEPGNADVHLAVGVAYGQAGDLERAIEHLRTAARLSPGDPFTHRNLAHALQLAGRSAEAEAELARARELERQAPSHR
jgi:tetratricopeptide (TPR) repeat protein